MLAPFANRQFVLMVMIAAFLLGCSKSTVRNHSSGKGSLGSLEIKFDLDGLGGISFSQDPSIATISFDDGKVVIDKHRLLLGGKEIAVVPEDAKEVLVKYNVGTLTITADGSTIYEQKIK